jgi:MFS family permease
MISTWHVLKVRIITPAPAPQPHRPTLNFWRAPGFASAIFVLLATHITFFSVYAITPAHLVNNLHADEAFMTIFALVELVVGAVIAARTHYIVERIGYANLIALSMVGTGISAFIFALAPSLPLTLLGSAITGAAWTAVGIGVFGYFIDHTPSEEMTRYSVAYMQLVGLGTFIGPLIGNWLINNGLEIMTVLLVGAILRLLSGIFIQYNPLETETPAAYLQPTPTHSGKKSSVSASRSA